MDEPARAKIKKFFRREDAFSGFCSIHPPFPSYLPTSSSLILPLEIDLTSKLNPRGQREEITRADFVLFFVDDAVVVASFAGSLVGNLLPRLMLHERGVSASSVKFSKTEANKPYVCTVRYLLFLSVRGSTGYNK